MKTISLVAVKRAAGIFVLGVVLGVALLLLGTQRTEAKPLQATRTFTVVNNCGYTVYPGIYPASTYANGGWTMAPGSSVTFSVPDGNIGRMWGRTGCNSASPASCTTGSCGGTGLQCAGTTGYPNTSLFEWNMNAGGTDWYNVSYVDAIDNPIGVRVSNTSCVSPSACSSSVLTNCPADLRSGNVCLSPCTRYNTDQYCCRGAYGTPQTCVVSQWAASAQTYVNNVHTYCPRQYAYAYDEVSGGALQTCPTGASYTVTFCPSGGGTNPTPVPTTPPPSSGVIFYQNINYGGTASGAKGPGDYASLPGDVPNDWMSSLRVPAGWTVQAYEHGSFGGAVCTYTADTAWVGSACNDRMSSFRIRSSTSNPTPTPPPSGGSQGVVNVSSNQARVWYKCTGTCSYVIVHYIRPGLSQQNIQMTYNSSLARWEYLVTGITAGQVLQYQFTYNNGSQNDTAWYSWTKP